MSFYSSSISYKDEYYDQKHSQTIGHDVEKL